MVKGRCVISGQHSRCSCGRLFEFDPAASLLIDFGTAMEPNAVPLFHESGPNEVQGIETSAPFADTLSHQFRIV